MTGNTWGHILPSSAQRRLPACSSIHENTLLTASKSPLEKSGDKQNTQRLQAEEELISEWTLSAPSGELGAWLGGTSIVLHLPTNSPTPAGWGQKSAPSLTSSLLPPLQPFMISPWAGLTGHEPFL